jgi:hypothetical protein
LPLIFIFHPDIEKSLCNCYSTTGMNNTRMEISLVGVKNLVYQPNIVKISGSLSSHEYDYLIPFSLFIKKVLTL